MKHVGIVTWYFGANYGALAQSIALYRTIKDMGYNCDMVNYKPKGYWKTIIVTNIPKKGHRLNEIGKTIRGLKKCYELTRYRYFTETKRVNTAEEIDQLGLDCIVLGSDAIFNIKHLLFTALYYGVGIKTKKVTYSPSCEFASEGSVLPQEFISSLKEMRALSVRDTNTYTLVKNNTGIEPELTLDPTFLEQFEDIDTPISENDYLLIYSFTDWRIYKDSILGYARKKGLKVISIGKQLDWADKSYAEASFEQWISAFRGASVVLTDSFHGTVFSLKNQKQIILCGRDDKKAKINSLLQQFDINIGVFKGESVEQYLQINSIDYKMAKPIIDREIQKSYDYLKSALEK